MSVIYADTSALVRAYVADEPDHGRLRGLLLEGEDPVVTSELARLELASALAAATRQGRMTESQVVLDRFDVDCADDGPVALLALDASQIFERARDLVRKHVLRTLDAIHLAVATTTAADLAGGEPVTLATRDDRQARVAEALGLRLA